jgi:tetratricopeptide (TPR) repeat protein
MKNNKINNKLRACGIAVFTICLFLCSIRANSQTNNELFDKANELYRTSKFTESIAIYEKIEKSGLVSSELYFNLGNAYYKINKVAESVYNYEKSLKLNPQNTDAKTNLVFAKRMTIDVIEELPKTVLQNIEQNYIQKFSYNQWAVASVVFSILTGLFFLLFYFSYIPNRKRFYFVSAALSVLLLIMSILFTYKEFDFDTKNIEAIVFLEKVSVNTAPTDNSDEAFELHEGTKVVVLDRVDTWKKIKISDGKIGWIQSNSIKEL